MQSTSNEMKGKNTKKRTLKTISLSLAMIGAGATASLSIGFMPGGPDIFGGGGGGMYDWGGGGIFGDVFGGGGGLSGNCDPMIINIAPDYDCSPDSLPSSNNGGIGDIANDVLTGNGGGIFDVVFETVSGELGLPPDVVDIIKGRKSVGDALEELALGTLEDLLGQGKKTPVMGEAGIPDYEDLIEIMRGPYGDAEGGEAKGEGEGEEDTPVMQTPNVHRALMIPTQALGVLTDTVTDRALSIEGQEIIAGRTAAAETTAKTSVKLSEGAALSHQGQMAVAKSLVPIIDEQTSTQDVLKKALAGQVMLGAQSTQFDEIAANQRTLATQLETIGLGVAQESYITESVTAKSVGHLNEQHQKGQQEQYAGQRSAEYENITMLRMMGSFSR